MRKILALAACLMLIGSITVGGTFAFSLSDLLQELLDTFGPKTQATEAQLDVQTLIQMRGENGLIDDQGQILIPVNQPSGFDWEAAKTETTVNGKIYALWTMPGVADKFISVKNNTAASESANSAYFRTAISVRCSDDAVWTKLHFNLNTTDFVWSGWKKTSGGYTNIATYPKALAPGETSPAMMMQIALDKSMTNAQMTKFGSEFKINAETVAIDTATFKQNGTQMTAQQALDAALPIDSFLN